MSIAVIVEEKPGASVTKSGGGEVKLAAVSAAGLSIDDIEHETRHNAMPMQDKCRCIFWLSSTCCTASPTLQCLFRRLLIDEGRGVAPIRGRGGAHGGVP